MALADDALGRGGRMTAAIVEIGRGEEIPQGPGRELSEYYSDLDCIVEDALWKPGRVGGRQVAVGLGAAAARVVPRPR